MLLIHFGVVTSTGLLVVGRNLELNIVVWKLRIGSQLLDSLTDVCSYV